MCNRCQQVCPAYNTGKELSPAALEINKRYYIRQHMGELAGGAANGVPLLDYAISPSAVWACTACGHCIEICPVGNVPMLDIMEIRRDQVMMQSEFPEQLTAAFRGMERMGNPWQAQGSRMEWAAGLPFDVPTVEENPEYEVLLWVGCAGAFNPDAQKTVRAVATILHAAGVSFATLGDDETCTGDSARRAGNEPLFQAMAEANIETLNACLLYTSAPRLFAGQVVERPGVGPQGQEQGQSGDGDEGAAEAGGGHVGAIIAAWGGLTISGRVWHRILILCAAVVAQDSYPVVLEGLGEHRIRIDVYKRQPLRRCRLRAGRGGRGNAVEIGQNCLHVAHGGNQIAHQPDGRAKHAAQGHHQPHARPRPRTHQGTKERRRRAASLHRCV